MSVNKKSDINKKFQLKISLPIQLLLVIFLTVLFGDYISPQIKAFSYALSLTIKEMLVFALPAMIFAFIFACILDISQGVVKIIALILIGVCGSNFISAMIGYYISGFVVDYVTISNITENTNNQLIPMWNLSLIKILSNDYALFTGILMGIFFSFRKSINAENIALKLRDIATNILNNIFIPIVPIFVLGFILKLQHEGNLVQILKDYTPVFASVITGQIFYLFFLYLLAAGFKFSKIISIVKNILPACIVGFSSMSSAAAMPLTIKGAEDSLDVNKDKARLFVPITTNIHLVGDGIFIPTVAFAIVATFGGVIPDFSTYLVFAFYFVLAKFAVAAIPGGGIIVMLPVLEKYFGMNADMLSLITALYIMFDSFITTMNIAGNAAFAIIFSKFMTKKKL